MPQNPIQFRHGMSMNEFIAAYGTESQCEAVLQQAHWPDCFVCPKCGACGHCTFVADGRRYWQCAHCRAQSTLRSGTLFHTFKLPLTLWFQAIYLVTQNKECISALSLKRHLGVSYRTAWRVKHKRRVNRRFDLRSLVGRLVYTYVNTAPCPEIWLRLGVARAV